MVEVEITDIGQDMVDYLQNHHLIDINRIIQHEQETVTISYNTLKEEYPKAAEKLNFDLDEYLNGALRAIILQEWEQSHVCPAVSDEVQFSEWEKERKIQKEIGLKNYVRITDLDETISIRSLQPKLLNKWVQIEGLIKTITQSDKPKIIRSAWRCPSCGHITHIIQEPGPITKPDQCEACTKKTLKLIPDLCEFESAQRMKIQERPEGLRGGDVPYCVFAELTGDLTGNFLAGTYIKVVGVYRAYAPINPDSPYLETIIEISSITLKEQDYEDITITDDDIKQIEELSHDPDIFTKLSQSIAPSIWGCEDIKNAVILQIFGGVTKGAGQNERLRGEIHILIVGDPGKAKSQMLVIVSKIVPRAVFTSGKGSSTAGLTAAITKDELDGRWSVEAGAMVLADKGLLCVDEIDKMNDNDRDALHGGMEQGQISINKAGINTTLKSRCSILAAANPKQGRFDNFCGLADQINLSPPLLSRFDLIFTMVDVANEQEDTAIAKHILNSHYVKGRAEAGYTLEPEELESISPIIPYDLVRKYIAYSKSSPPPVLTREANELIEKYFVSLRGIAAKSNKPMPVTARQIEGIVRLAEASAKIRLDRYVTEDDAKRAISSVDACLRQIAYDPETGVLDYDRLGGSVPKSKRDKKRTILNVLKELAAQSEKGLVSIEELKTTLSTQNIKIDNLDDILHALADQDGEIIFNRGKIRPL